MANKQKIVRRKLSDEVFDRLVGMIESEEFSPGDKFPSERELMDEFGVGRPAIREALQALEKMGFISISHGERARVSTPTAVRVFEQIDLPVRRFLSTSPDNLDDLKEARLLFEVGMVRIAAKKATSVEIEKLQQDLQHQTEALGHDPAEFIKADMSFHATIAAISGNRIFEATSKAILSWFATFHEKTLHWKGREQFTLEEHGNIIERIAAHDPDGAASAMEDHLNRARAFYSAENNRNKVEEAPSTPTN